MLHTILVWSHYHVFTPDCHVFTPAWYEHTTMCFASYHYTHVHTKRPELDTRLVWNFGCFVWSNNKTVFRTVNSPTNINIHISELNPHNSHQNNHFRPARSAHSYMNTNEQLCDRRRTWRHAETCADRMFRAPRLSQWLSGSNTIHDRTTRPTTSRLHASVTISRRRTPKSRHDVELTSPVCLFSGSCANVHIFRSQCARVHTESVWIPQTLRDRFKMWYNAIGFPTGNGIHTTLVLKLLKLVWTKVFGTKQVSIGMTRLCGVFSHGCWISPFVTQENVGIKEPFFCHDDRITPNPPEGIPPRLYIYVPRYYVTRSHSLCGWPCTSQ
jgi:hypothetical protein